MAIFVVFATSNLQAVERAAEKRFEGSYLRVNDNSILISAGLTATEVSDALGISEGENGSGIVFKMSSYFGRYSVAVWDWIKTKAEQPHG